jgi:putative tricarboxylic transport membrane protein
MSVFDSILLGFSVALQPINLLFCFVGVLCGTLIGVLPGLGPPASISLLLPVTFVVPPTASLIMLAGIYYGAMYGGSTTSILVNIPGEAASVVTCFDGYAMARQGRAGPALGISAFGSFIGGTASVFGLAFLSNPLTRFALKFGAPEYFSMMILGIMLVIYIGKGSILKSLVTAGFGIFLGTIGTDLISGYQRFTFRILEFADGIGIVPVVIGLFGISEVLMNVEEIAKERSVFKSKTDLRELLPTLQDWSRSKWPIVRGSIIGFLIGVLPGGTPILGSFASYAVEKKLSRTPEKFGTGMVEGVAGPETANNAATTGAFIPLLTLGIPVNAVMGLLLGALIIHGVQPGPLLINSHPDLFWGVIVSMYIGNIMLLVLNLPLIGAWVQILRVPYPVLFPLILLFCMVGAYTINNSLIELGLAILFGILGFIMRRCDYEVAPLVLSLILSPLIENNLRQSLLMSDGSPMIFFRRPISATFLIATFIIIVLSFLPIIKRSKLVFEEEM